MFSFYKIVEALNQLYEDGMGDAGVAGLPTSSGVAASGAINPPENPGKKKIISLVKTKEPEGEPAEKDLKGPVEEAEEEKRYTRKSILGRLAARRRWR